MKKADLIEYFGSLSKASICFGLDKNTISSWPDPIPFEMQCAFAVLTGGELKADRRNPRYRGNTLGKKTHERRLREAS